MYQIVRPIAAFALKIFFRKIYFTHRDRIPKGKPLLLAINHPTAFIEPCICACFLPMPLYFLVRGDLFKKPLFRKFLNILHMVPIYRMKEDGLDQVKKNDTTFQFCYQALNEKKTVVILPEGKTIQEKRLRPIRKGLARIAFGTYEKYGDIDLHIVPIGVNFTEADQFRSVAMFHVAEPIRLRDYYDAHAENPKKAIRLLTAKVKEDLENHIVNIPKVEDETLAEQLFEVNRNNRSEKIFPLVSENIQPIQAEMKIANEVSEMTEDEKNNKAKTSQDYFSDLKKHEVNDFGVKNSSFSNFKNLLLLIVGFLPAVIGFAINYPMAGYAKRFSQSNVKQLEFKAPVAIAIGLGISVLIIIVTLLLAIFWNWWVILIFIGVFYLGRYSLIYFEFWGKYSSARKFQNLNESTRNDLSDKRNGVSKIVKALL